MIGFFVLSVFIAGLMIGRTPEYLGKKIEALEMKMAVITVLFLASLFSYFRVWHWFYRVLQI
jgi:K+-transporting ATPase A subunit